MIGRERILFIGYAITMTGLCVSLIFLVAYCLSRLLV